MFELLLQPLKARWAIRKWRNSPLGKVLAAHTQEYFTKYPRLADWKEETKTRVIEDFYQNVIAIWQAENPFLAMRERIASIVVLHSELAVLCQTEEDKAAQFYSDCPYISGQLHRHIDNAVPHVKELRELKWTHPEVSGEELVSACNTRTLLYLYYLNGFNYVRMEFDDFPKEKDWLRPFMKSMMIWQEDSIREKLGLERLLPNSLDGLKHSTFMNIVVNGHRNPYFEWDTHWNEERS